MRIAHFNPLPPDRTGVADYCWELLPELARHAEIDVWIDRGRGASPPQGCGLIEWHDPVRFAEQLSQYDATIYHLGNSRYHRELYRAFLEHPGAVVMHDFVLHHFFAECFIASAPERYWRRWSITMVRWGELWRRISWRAGWHRCGRPNQCSFL